MPQPNTLYFDDGKGRIRQVPSDKLDIFKQYFPNATQADERALRQIEEERAARSEKEGKTKIPEIKLRQPDLTGLHGSVSLQENASIPEVAKDVLNIHRYDPEISFSAKYGAYKDNPELFRDRWEDTENVPLTELAQKKYDQIKAKSRPKGMTPIVPVGYVGVPAKPQQEKPDELESLKDFLTNTPSGRGFVEYDKKRKESFAQLDKQLNAEIANLEKEINEKSSARQKLIERGVPGTRYGVNPSWLSREERAEIEAVKAKDIEEADKIATQDDLDLAMKSLNELKMLQAAVKDKDRNAVSQFFREFGRRLPESLVNIGTMGLADVVEAMDQRQTGPIAQKTEDILSQYASLHQNDRTIAQDIAQGTTGSLEFMAQFAGAGGIVKGAAGAIGKKLLTEGTKQAAKGVGKALKIAGKEVSESLLQTAIMPSTLATAIEKNAENPGSFLDNYANAYLSNLVEVGSERVGGFVPVSRFEKILPPSIQKIRRATGIQGGGVEFLEEQFATAGHAALGDEQAEWKDLVDPRQQLITAGVVGVIQLPYAAINAGGYAAAKYNDKNQKRSINQAYTNNLTNIQSIFGDEAKDVISWVNGIIDNNSQDAETISKIISGIATSNEFDEKQSDALIKYSLAYLAKNGLERGKNEEIQQVQKEAQETIQQTINPETNSIILAKIPGVDEPTFIQGNIVLHEDGSIDTHRSGEIYYTDSNGNRQVIDPKFVEIIENVPSEMAIEEATAVKTAEVVNRQANDEVRQYEPGETVRFTSGGNTSLIGKIANVDESGNYQVMVDGVPAPVNVEPRMIIEEDNLRGVDNGVQVDYTDEKGNIVTGTVDDMSLRNNGIIVIDEKEVPSVNVIGVHREEQAKQEEVDRMSEIPPENEGTPAEQIEQNVTETAKAETKGQTALPEETGQPSEQDADAEKQTFMQSLPIVLEGKNKGQIDQSRMTPEQNIKYFEYQYGPDKALRAATKMVDNLKERIKKEQAKLDADPFNIAQNDLVENLLAQQKVYQDYTNNEIPVKEEVQVTESAPGKKANIEPVEESVTTKAPVDVPEQAARSNKKRTTTVIRQDEQQEQATRDENMSDADRFLSDIEKQKEAIRQEVEKMTPKQREEWWGEPQSLREYIMREFINGQKILWSDTPTSQGLGHHIGLGRSGNERRKYIGLIGSQGKTNAKTPEAIAHQIWEEVVSKGEQDEIGTLFHGYDTMQVLDELLDVLSSYYSKGQMIDAINESRLDQIFEEMDMAVNASMSSNAWDIDPNEESQNKMLRLLYFDDAYNDITDQEINEYYVKQVTFDEFEEQISNFIKNYSSYDETGISGSDYKNAEQGSESSYGERRDQDSTGDSESTGEIDRNDEGEAEAPEESAEPIRDGENDQEGGSENAQGSSDGNQNVDGERIDQLIKRAEANLKAKQTAYSRLYDKYLSLKNKAEKDPNYGMAGQADIFGGVSGSDNLFANNRDEINSGIRQLIIKAKAQAEDAEMEFNSARKELDRLKTEQTNKKFGQKELFGSEPNGEIESASNRYDVNGNKILTAEEWNSLSKEQQEKHENTINKPVTDLEGNTFNVDYNIAEPLQKIINAGFATGQSDSGTLSDHPGYRYVEDDKLGRYKKGEPVNNTGAYLTFWKPEATKIAEAGRKINTQEQIDYIRNVANKLGFEVLDTNIFNQPSIHLSLPYTNNGKGRQEILNEAGKLTDKKYPGLKEKNFLEWIDKRNEEFEPIVVQKNGGIKIWTDQEIINKWNDLADELAKFNDTNSNEKVTNNYNDRKQALTQEADKVIKEVDWKPTKNGNNANQEIDKKEKLEDFGEKIGGARKDMGITRKARDTDSLPAWRRKYRYANADSKITIGDKVNTDSPFSVVYVHKSGNRESLRTVTDIFSKGWTPKIFNSEQEAEDYIPIFEANLQGFRVSKKSENEYVIGKRSSTGKTIEFVSFPTREEAETYLRSTEGATSLLNRKREDFSIPALENVERTGKDYRKGRNISTDEFMKTFGFRGGEFGNWVKPEERQTMLNMAYDSFMDMTDILGISPRAISLNGELGIAFGSRGIAAASAHFEPLRAVINLTRMNGAGSLAHEWAHALDNYFGLQAANKNYAKDKNGELIAGRVFKSESDLSYIQNGMRDELRRIFENIVKSTQKKKAPQDVAIEKLQNQYANILKHVDREANSLVNKFELGVKRYKYDRKKNEHQNIVIKGTADQVKKVRELVEKISSGNGDTPKWNYIPGKKNKISYISTELLDIDKLHKDVFGKSGIEKDSDGFYNFAYYATKLYETKERLDKAKDGGDPDVEIETEYMENSKKFDKSRAKPYWSTKVEMFARAFEYYIQSNLDDKGIRSDYLQYDKAPVYMELYDMTPYPMGEERTYLNKLFKDFFDTVQEKVDEETGNVALFHTGESKESLAKRELKKGISALEKILQKMGVDIETIELPETGAQQSIPITDDMRGYAENGMPLFSIAQMSEDIDTRLNAAKTPQEKTKIVSDMVDELESRYRKSVDTVVLPTKKDVFESLRMMGADSELLSMAEKTKAKLNGVYFNGTIYLNSASLDKAKNVAEVWAHENFHAWISDKKELLVPLINNLEDDFLNANLHAYYHKLDKEEKVNELLAFAVGRIFTGRDIAKIKEADIILPVIIKYLDYVTEGEFSQSGARVRSGRKSDADALRDNQRGVPQSERINQQGEVSYQPQQENGTVLPGYGGISGAGRVAESSYTPMPRQKEGQSLEDYSREVSDWYFKQRERPNQPLFSVSDVADRTGSKMPEDLRREYDIKYDRFFTRFREAWEDTFLPVKDFLDLLRKNGVEIAEYNDFYKQATHLQGKNDAQLKIFKDNYQHPITLAVSVLVKKGFRYRDIENYVFAKHGLERNEYMRNAAIEEWENNHPEAEEDERAAFIKSLPNDYAGITALEEEFKQPAEMFIDSFENKAGEEDINRLWAAINNATRWTLTKQYQTGMINKEVYDDLMNRYQYYVPLRGHDKETAEDRWDYTPNMGTFFTAPLVRAKGRRSRAESPFAFIEQMAHSAIVQGNKNTLKQSILRLAQKENGGLMSATKTWKVNIGTKEKPIWEQQSAPYSEDLDTYLQNQQLFEERMQQLKKEGMAYQGRARLDIGDLFIKPKQAEQHEIRVYQNGISYTVYINANPAIAKAINGANRKDISNNLGLFSTITRNMAANFTTRNPLFVMTNFSRDYIYSTTMLLAKETPEFMLDFQRNLPAAANALRRYERGNVDLNKKSDQYLYEYMINGGKTGFSHIFELDRVAKSLEREAQKGGKKNFADHARAIIDVIDMFNEVAENTTRLSVYITSREHGKSIIDSINDAKNITVNFNQKGAGSSVGKNSFEQVILSAAGWVRPLYLFSNAAIQALSNIVKVTSKHPVKMASILSSYALIGFISPMLAAMIGGDDGEDDYMKLSDWERQSNWCVLLPNGSFLKIPLPQELRIFSRMGDNIYQAYTGKKDILQVLMDIAFSISDLLPMNPLGAAGTSWAELSPDFARPIIQIVGTNTNFMGSRIYNEWANKNMPGYLKAKTNKKGEYYAPNFMVDWFMILDHLTGGDGVKKGVISLNPDITNHLLRGYFGGLYTIAEQGVGIASEVYNFTKTGELDIKVRETPLRAFYADKNDLQLQSSGISSRYYDIYDKVIESRRRAKAYTEKVQQGEMGIDEYSRVMSELNMPKINAIYDRIKEIKRIEREMKEMNPQQQKQAEEMIFDLRKEVVELNGNQ